MELHAKFDYESLSQADGLIATLREQEPDNMRAIDVLAGIRMSRLLTGHVPDSERLLSEVDELAALTAHSIHAGRAIHWTAGIALYLRRGIGSGLYAISVNET